MKKIVLSISSATLLFVALSASAQITMTPLATWSPNGDGWLAPGEGGYTFLGTANLERGPQANGEGKKRAGELNFSHGIRADQTVAPDLPFGLRQRYAIDRHLP